jgi:hypothetical protein
LRGRYAAVSRDHIARAVHADSLLQGADTDVGLRFGIEHEGHEFDAADVVAIVDFLKGDLDRLRRGLALGRGYAGQREGHCETELFLRLRGRMRRGENQRGGDCCQNACHA